MSITKKLLDFQKMEVKIEKDAQNPHFRSKYSSLNEVLGKVKKPLADMGVLIVQSPEQEGVRTTLTDKEDDTHLESFVPYVNASDMQKLGGAISYARRYSLIALLGLEDEDDDGESAMPRKKATGVGDMTTAPDFNL